VVRRRWSQNTVVGSPGAPPARAVAVTIDTESFPPEVLTIRGRTD
jgi:hypothetical protein